jgi:acyl dehydratase
MPDEQRRAVHVEQDSTFHRTIQPGDVLITTARIAGLRQTRAGALVQTCLVTTDAVTDAAVITTWHGAIYRGVAVEGDPGARRLPPSPRLPRTGQPSVSASDPAESPPEHHWARPDPEQVVPIVVAREMAHVYSECSGIWNPIHTERRAARAAGLPGIILHGSATWALAGRELVRVFADHDVRRLRRLRARFAAPVVPGTTLALCHGTPDAAGGVCFFARDAEGRAVLSDGFAVIAPPDGDPGS